MKSLRTAVCLAYMVSGNLFAIGQERVPLNEPDLNKPTLFRHLPSILPADPNSIQKLLESEMGKSVSTNLSATTLFQFEGIVTVKINKYDGQVSTTVIRSTNFPGANLTISRVGLINSSAKIIARIISFRHGDAFELQNHAGKLSWVKRDYYAMVNE